MNVIEELKRLLATPMSDETFKTKVQALVDKAENDEEVVNTQPDCACDDNCECEKEDCGCDALNDVEEDKEIIVEDDSEIVEDDEEESDDEELTEDQL